MGWGGGRGRAGTYLVDMLLVRPMDSWVLRERVDYLALPGKPSELLMIDSPNAPQAIKQKVKILHVN